MNINKNPLLDQSRVERATFSLRALKHPIRFRIVEWLMQENEKSPTEIAGFLGMQNLTYLHEQMDRLQDAELVSAAIREGQVFFAPNKARIVRLMSVVSNFAAGEADDVE